MVGVDVAHIAVIEAYIPMRHPPAGGGGGGVSPFGRGLLRGSFTVFRVVQAGWYGV